MFVLVTYDVKTDDPGGPRRLRHVAKVCQKYGHRVQNSVFECQMDPGQWVVLRATLLRIIDLAEDSVRFYHLGSNWERKVEHIGRVKAPSPDEPLII